MQNRIAYLMPASEGELASLERRLEAVLERLRESGRDPARALDHARAHAKLALMRDHGLLYVRTNGIEVTGYGGPVTLGLRRLTAEYGEAVIAILQRRADGTESTALPV